MSLSQIRVQANGVAALLSLEDRVVSDRDRKLVTVPVPHHTSDDVDAPVTLEPDGTNAPSATQPAYRRRHGVLAMACVSIARRCCMAAPYFQGSQKRLSGMSEYQAVRQIQRYDLGDFHVGSIVAPGMVGNAMRLWGALPKTSCAARLRVKPRAHD
jgi:hypothetical protein